MSAPPAASHVTPASTSFTEQHKAAMLLDVSLNHNHALLESGLDTSDLRDKLMELRHSYSILLIGNMGAGPSQSSKTSLINSVVGAPLMPMSPPGRANQQTDTMCLVEICNDPDLAADTFTLSVVLKDPRAWSEDWTSFLDTVKSNAFAVAADDELDLGLGLGDEMADVPAAAAAAAAAAAPAAPVTLGAEFGTDMLRALHARCFDPNDDTERIKVLQYLDARGNNDAAVLALENDHAINNVLALRTINVEVRGAAFLTDLLARLCRSFSSRDAVLAHRLQDPLQAFQASCPELLALLAVGDPWPLIRLVSVSGHLSHSVLPPFTRLIDSPGLGGDQSLTGVDTFSFIQRCLHDRVLSEVWYVSSFIRDVATTMLKDMDQLGQLLGHDQVRFVVTQSDCSNVLVNNAEYLSKLKVKATDIQHKTGIPFKVAAKQTIFVSAMGHAHYRNIPLPGIDTLRATIQQNVHSVQQARILTLVEVLVKLVWAHIAEVCAVRGEFITSHLAALTVLGVAQAPQANAQAEPMNVNLLVQQQLQSSSQAVAHIVATFRAAMQMLAMRVQHPMVCSNLAAAVSNHLDRLAPRTVQAVLARGGRFSGRGAGSADVSSQVWREFLALPVAAAPPVVAGAGAAAAAGPAPGVAMRFGDACDQFFRDASTVFQQARASLAVTLALQAGAARDKIEVAQRGVAQTIARYLYALRQDVTLAFTVAEALQDVPQYKTVWSYALRQYEQTVSGKKAAGIAGVNQQLKALLPVSTARAVLDWVTYVRRQLVGQLDEELQKMACDVQQSIQLQVQDARPLLELLLRYAAPFVPVDHPLRVNAETRLRQLMQAPMMQPAVGAGVAAAPSRLNDRRWIKTSARDRIVAPAVDNVLLFRGLCAVDESQYPQPILGVPQQLLLRTMTSTAPADQALANALAGSSGAAVVEAILAGIRSRNPQSTVEQINAELRQLAQWSQPLSLLFSAETLQEAGLSVHRAVVAGDTLDGNEQAAWARFLKQWSKRHTPAHNRQELYSKNTKNFLKGLEHFVRLLKPALADASEVVCPYGAMHGGTEIQSWFHWHWLSPHHGLLLPLATDLPKLHANPFVSSSQGLEHALKYAIGLKNYRTAQQKGEPVPLLYLDNGKVYVLPGASPPLIGVVLVSSLTQQFVQTDPHLHVVLQMLEQGLITLPGGSKRIGSEAEVTLYGCMPSKHTQVLVRWPLLQPNLDQHNDVLRVCYGITNNQRGNSELQQLRALAVNAATSEAADKMLRQRLGMAAGHAITAHLSTQYNQVIGFEEQVLLR